MTSSSPPFSFPGLEWSDIVLLCDAASRSHATVEVLHGILLAAGSTSPPVDATMDVVPDKLDCRKPARRRRIEKAMRQALTDVEECVRVNKAGREYEQVSG